LFVVGALWAEKQKTHHEIGNGRNGEIHQNFHQRIDLVLFAHRTELEKCKAGVHGQHHDAAEQDK